MRGEHIWARSDLFSDRQSPKCKHAPCVNNFLFDLACDVIADVPGLQNYISLDRFGGTIKRRLNFENRTCSFGDRRGSLNSPPSQSRYGIYPSQARVNLNICFRSLRPLFTCVLQKYVHGCAWSYPSCPSQWWYLNTSRSVEIYQFFLNNYKGDHG